MPVPMSLATDPMAVMMPGLEVGLWLGLEVQG